MSSASNEVTPSDRPEANVSGGEKESKPPGSEAKETKTSDTVAQATSSRVPSLSRSAPTRCVTVPGEVETVTPVAAEEEEGKATRPASPPT